MSLHLLGADPVTSGYGSLYGGIIKAVGDLGTAGLSAYDTSEKEKKTKADAQAKLDAVKAADTAKALADAMAGTSVALAAMPGAKADAKDKAAADKEAAGVVTAMQVKAVAALAADQMAARTQYDNEQLAAAVKKLQADSKSVYNKALVAAWKALIAGGGAVALVEVKPGDHAGAPGMAGWKIGVIVGASAVAATGIGLALWGALRRKVGG